MRSLLFDDGSSLLRVEAFPMSGPRAVELETTMSELCLPSERPVRGRRVCFTSALLAEEEEGIQADAVDVHSINKDNSIPYRATIMFGMAPTALSRNDGGAMQTVMGRPCWRCRLAGMKILSAPCRSVQNLEFQKNLCGLMTHHDDFFRQSRFWIISISFEGT